MTYSERRIVSMLREGVPVVEVITAIERGSYLGEQGLQTRVTTAMPAAMVKKLVEAENIR